MRDILMIAVNAVLPLAVMMAVGYGVRRLGLLDDKVLAGLNSLVSKLLLPCVLFVNMYNSDLKAHFSPRLFWFTIGAVLVDFLAFLVVVPRIEKDDKRRGAMVHALFRGNTAIYGLPLALGIVGAQGDVSDIVLLMGVTILLYNVLGVLTLQLFGEGKRNFGSVVVGVIKNPMIIGGILGLILSLLSLRLPEFVLSPAASFSAATTPIAFLALGASFNFKASADNRRVLAGVTVIRLVAIPLLWILVGTLALGFRGGAVAALLAVFATPTAVNTFPLAAAAKADSRLAGEIVVYTTVFSVVTLFLFVFALKSFGMI